MKLKITLLIAAFASLFASAIYAGRATDGNAKRVYYGQMDLRLLQRM